MYHKTILVLILVCVSATVQAADNTDALPMGRPNPFAPLVVPVAPEPEVRAEIPTPQMQPQQMMTPVVNKPDLFVETVEIKWLDAENLKTATVNMCSQFGTITVDKRSNCLIICDTKENLKRIVTELKKTDKTPASVNIEVVIVDVQLDNDTDVGVNWDILSDTRNHLGFRQSLTDRVTSTPENDVTVGNATAFNSTGLGSDLSIVTGTVRTVVHLLQTKRKVEILASPSVTVLSGRSGFVQTVEEIPYQEKTDTSQGGSYAATEFKKVGVKLNVTATVIDNNTVLLTIEPEQNSNTGTFGINDIPIIDTRSGKTDLMLKDGQVVIMGGLRNKEKTTVRDQVPLLGELPLVGFLFGRDRITLVNSELLVFISPHICNGGLPLTAKNAEKLNYVQKLPGVPLPDTDTK
jgi:type II secretory pathway component GspD/PulD (secretin)